MPPRRGRPPRNGERSDYRLQIGLTRTEFNAVKTFTRKHQLASMADAARLILLDAIAEDAAFIESTIQRLPENRSRR